MRAIASISAFLTGAHSMDAKRDERGVAMTEYVVVIALVVVGCLAVLGALWPALTGVIANAITSLP